MSDWGTPSRTGKRQPNPYSVLEEGHYTPREKSGPTKEQVGIDQQTWYPTAMSDETTKGEIKSIAGYLTKSKGGYLIMKPVEEPTKVDLITFKTNVGTALMKCKSTNDGGHVYLILNQEEYRDKIKDETATLPCKTIRPKKPIGDTVTTASYAIYKETLADFKLSEEYEQQLKDLIETKFPNGLNGLEDDDGELPFNLTAKQCLTHIEGKLKDDGTTTTRCYTDLIQGLLNREYTDNANGAENWFKEAESDRIMANRLGYPYISYRLIMGIAQGAFHNSDLDIKDTLAIDVKWKIYSEGQKEPKKQTTTMDEHERHEKETYRYFKNLYNKDLRLLHVRQKPRKTTARAYEAIAMDDWRSNVEHNLNQMNIGQEDLATALSANMRDNMSLATTHPGGSIAIPSAITAGSSLTNDQYSKILNAISALQTKSQPTYEQRPQANSYDQRPKIWKQYKCWCYSCGVNLSHNSNECRIRKFTAHSQHPTATFNNQQGGNGKKDSNWMKWNSPRGEICDNRGP
jgi:hypothetical protein